MDAAAEAAVARTEHYDLVRVEPNDDGPVFHGLVIQLPDDVDSLCAPLPPDTVRLLRVDGTLNTAKADDITVIDRNYFELGGAVVSSATGQIGIVTGVNTVLDLVKLSSEPEPAVAMSGVSPDRLRRVRELSLGDFVVSGPWLGRVIEVSLSFNVLFDDGAVCKVVREAQRKKLEPAVCAGVYSSVTNSWIYPGQRVKGPAEIFKGCRWLNGHWQPNHTVGTISKVEMAGVLVYWIASTHPAGTDASTAPPPAAYQHPGNLTLFCSASYCYWHIRDRCFVRTHKQGVHYDHHQPAVDFNLEQDQKTSSSTPTEEARKSRKKLVFHLGKRRTRREQRRHAEFEQPMSVTSTSTTVDVMWQDGTRQSGLPSTSLQQYTVTHEHEIFPEFYVTDMAAEASGQPRRVGVVRRVSFEDQTACVLWLKQASNPDEGGEEDTVSVYDLDNLLDNIFSYGNVVVRLLPPSGGTNTAAVQAPPAAQSRKMRAPAATDDLSWVGRVVDLRDGRVHVKWGDGSTSAVLPHEISVVNQERHWELRAEMGIDSDDEGFNELQDEDSSDEDSDGTDSSEEGDDDSVDNDGTDSADEDRIDPMDEDDIAATTTSSRLGAIVQYVLRLASQVLAPAMRYLPNRSSSSLSSEVDAASANAAPPAVVAHGNNGDTNNGDAIHATAAAAISDDDTDNDDADCAEKGESTEEATGFPHFDVTQSPPNHHYIDNLDQGSNGEKKWVKAVQKEWKILKNNLPDAIYVRAFEDRMDLLRAVIVGASGTPYQDGLFFFDMHLPTTYPAVPPLVYYHSFGLRLNPNLDNSGTVCLSLLNTFGGEGTEVWQPATSTLLQVVVSIQGLILNNQPFFNEAGYDALVGRPEGRRNALPYSENACFLTLQSMLHLLRRPPQGFEEFVRDHFRHRGRFVLRACEAYLRGCIVGTLDGDAHATEASKEDEHPCSAGLRLVLANVVPRLVTAFTEIGAEGCECDQFHRLHDMLVGADGPPCASHSI